MTALISTQILIAEDERSVRMLLRIILEGAGATVLEAENGAQALRLLELEAGNIDLVVSDLNMPELDGEGLVDALRLRWGPTLPVVMCSAMNIAARSPQLLRQVHSVVSKPFSPQELVGECARAIAAARIASRPTAV